MNAAFLKEAEPARQDRILNRAKELERLVDARRIPMKPDVRACKSAACLALAAATYGTLFLLSL